MEIRELFEKVSWWMELVGLGVISAPLSIHEDMSEVESDCGLLEIAKGTSPFSPQERYRIMVKLPRRTLHANYYPGTDMDGVIYDLEGIWHIYGVDVPYLKFRTYAKVLKEFDPVTVMDWVNISGEYQGTEIQYRVVLEDYIKAMIARAYLAKE
jgi:hypothetical protein